MENDEKYKHLVRMHNLPRKCGLGDILHFLWEAVEFDADSAIIRAYSAKNAIVGFTTSKIAQEAITYCTGRILFGRTISLHQATEADLDRVLKESREAGPEEGPPRLKLKKMKKENNDGALLFVGFYSHSESDSDGMDLEVPGFYTTGPSPDTITFRSRQSSGSLGQDMELSSSTSSAMDIEIEQLPQLSDKEPEVINSNKRKIDQCVSAASPDDRQILSTEENKIKRFDKKIIDRNNDVELAYRSPLQRLSAQKQTANMPEKRPRLQSQQQITQPPVKFFSNAVLPTIPRRPDVRPQKQQPPNNRVFFLPPIPQRLSSGPPPPNPRHANLVSLGTRPAVSIPIPPRLGQPEQRKNALSAQFDMKPEIVISSQHCLIKWIIPENNIVDHQRLTIVGSDNLNIVHELGREKKHLQPVKPGATYTATMQGYDFIGKEIAAGRIEFRAHFSPNEMSRLYELAQQFCGDYMLPLFSLHRCKPKAYFDDIYQQPDGRRMMMPYLKDENGHPASPINGVLSGMFFSTLLCKDTLPDTSPFGDVQMLVDIEKILNFNEVNMYFADFYCNQAFPGVQNMSSALHYVTIVVCKKKSTFDRYCSAVTGPNGETRLVRLNPSNNKFLKILNDQHNPNDSPLYLGTSRQELLVEIYYTEPISLFEASKFREVQPFGKGKSNPKGLPNNKICQTCNF